MQTTIVITEVSKEAVESHLGIEINTEAFERAYEHAKRKLARIIEREGDLDGARLQPVYITQLTVEAVKEQSFSEFTLYSVMRTEKRRRYMEKKEMPVVETTGQI